MLGKQPRSPTESISHLLSSSKSSSLLVGLSEGSVNLLDLNKEDKILGRWQIGQSSLSCLAILGHDESSVLKNCFLAVSEDCWMKLIDLRSKSPVWEEKTNQLKGIPSTICKSHYNDQIIIGTSRGFIDVFDIRKRLVVENYLLKRGEDNLPITQIQNFIPTSSFKNMAYSNTIDKYNHLEIDQLRRDYFLIHYPSHYTEFSVFPLKSFLIDSERSISPLIHFQAENEMFSNSSMRSCEIPYLKRLNTNSLVDINYKLNTEGMRLSRRLLNMQHILEKDKALYTDILKGNLEFLVSTSKLSVMQEQFMQRGTFERQWEYLQSITSCMVIPDQLDSQLKNYYFDNIIIMAGEDRNIRFLNLGNEFKYNLPMSEDYKNLKCYLLSNSDYKRRSYFYHYNSEICMIRESFKRPKANSSSFTDFDGFSQAFGFSNLESEVYEMGLSQSHIYNIGKPN